MNIKWQEVNLDDAIRYFAEGFKAPDGWKIVRYEFRIDIYTRTVTFKLFIEKADK